MSNSNHFCKMSPAVEVGTVDEDSVRYDVWGFENRVSNESPHRILPEKVHRGRVRKWREMLDHWDEWKGKKPDKIVSRACKGIPSELRGEAWYCLCGAKSLQSLYPDLYENCRQQSATLAVVDQIGRDIDRTFPDHILLSTEEGQEALRRILLAYAVYQPLVGYTQGMGFLAAVLLMHMEEDQAFYTFLMLIEVYFVGYFSDGLKQLTHDTEMLDILLEKKGNSLKKTMNKLGVKSLFFTPQHWMSLFSVSLPWPSVLRVWDQFLAIGPKIFFVATFAVLEGVQADIKARKSTYPEALQLFIRVEPAQAHENLLTARMAKWSEKLSPKLLLKVHIKADEKRQHSRKSKSRT